MLLRSAAQAGPKVPFVFECISRSPDAKTLEEWKSYDVEDPKLIEYLRSLPQVELDKRCRVAEICDAAARLFPELRQVSNKEDDEDDPVIEFYLALIRLPATNAVVEAGPSTTTAAEERTTEADERTNLSKIVREDRGQENLLAQPSPENDNPLLSDVLRQQRAQEAIGQEGVLARHTSALAAAVERSKITDEEDERSRAESAYEHDDFAEIAAMGLAAEREAKDRQAAAERARRAAESVTTEETQNPSIGQFYRDTQVREWSPLLANSSTLTFVWVKCWSERTDVECARMLAKLPDFFATLEEAQADECAQKD